MHTPVHTPLLSDTIDEAELTTLCSMVAISQQRTEVGAIRADTPLPFADLWARLSKLKGTAQWRSKLVSMGGDPPAVAKLVTNVHVGEYMYRHLKDDGTLSPTALQEAPPS